MCLKGKLEGSTGHVGNERQIQSLGERMGGKTRPDQSEVFVPFVLAITMVGRGEVAQEGDRI